MKMVTVQFRSGRFLMFPLDDEKAENRLLAFANPYQVSRFQDEDGEWNLIPHDQIEFAYTSECEPEEEETVVH